MWVVALAIDYLGPVVIGVGRGWRVAPEHFAERHGLIVLIALGESIIALGVGAGFELDTGVIVGAVLGIVVVSALWWLYFDVAAIFAREEADAGTGLGAAPARAALVQLPPPANGRRAGLFALGLEKTLARRCVAVPAAVAVGLCGGAGLYLLAHIVIPLPNDRPSLSAADDRGRRAARARPGRTRDPGARGARPRERRVLAGRGLGGDPLSGGPVRVRHPELAT